MKKNTFFGEYAYELDEFEVSKGSEEGKIIEFVDMSAGLGLEHKFRENIIVNLSAGAVFNRKIEFQDGTSKAAPKTSPYVGADFLVRF